MLIEGLPPTETMLVGFGIALVAALVLIFAERVMNPRLRLLLMFIGLVLAGIAAYLVFTSIRNMPQPEPA